MLNPRSSSNPRPEDPGGAAAAILPEAVAAHTMSRIGRNRQTRPGLGLGRALVVALCALGASHGASAVEPIEKDILGWAEPVLVGESRLEMTAKLDTGAETSSLDAVKIRRYRKSGRRWVEFLVQSRESGRRVTFRRRLVREVRIKEHDGRHQERPVVTVDVCLGTHLRTVEVSLIDRGEFDYQMLLGRKAVAGIAVVDPELLLTRMPSCYDGEDVP